MTPIERAKGDVKRLEGDLARIKTQMAAIEARIAKTEAYIEMAMYYETEEAHLDGIRTRGNGAAINAVRIATELIKEKGEAMHTRQLLKAIEERGLQIGGKDPVANLSGFLSRSSLLRSSRALGWGLAEWGAPSDEGTAEENENPLRNPEIVPMAPAGYESENEVPF